MLKEIERQSHQSIEKTEREELQLFKAISEIVLRKDGKHRCLFKPQDPIFLLEQEAEMPTDDQKAKLVQHAMENGGLQCTTCCAPAQSLKKLKFCQFCVKPNCSNCLYKSRPFPRNKNSRGNICVQCDKKFLYNDALGEQKLKLEVRDTQVERNIQVLKQLEHKYEFLVTDLTQVNLQRSSLFVKSIRHIQELQHIHLKQQEEL